MAMRMTSCTPPGQGWWPVIAIQLQRDAGVVRQGKVLIICFYQLMADELIAWWIGYPEQ